MLRRCSILLSRRIRHRIIVRPREIRSGHLAEPLVFHLARRKKTSSGLVTKLSPEKSFGVRMRQAVLSRFQIFVVLLALLATSCSLGARAPQMTSTLIVGNSHIDITVDDGKLNVPQADVIAWIQAGAES